MSKTKNLSSRPYIATPQTQDEFERLRLGRLWLPFANAADDGWLAEAHVSCVERSYGGFSVSSVSLSFECNGRRLPRITGIGKMIEACVLRGLDLELRAHCGCGECDNEALEHRRIVVITASL